MIDQIRTDNIIYLLDKINKIFSINDSNDFTE